MDKILSALNIARVVCVDDTYKDKPPVEEVIPAAAALSPGALKELLPELGDTVPDEPDVLGKRIRGLWAELAPDVRERRTEGILAAVRLQDGQKMDDPGDAAVLHELIPGEKLLTLSPKQWEQQRSQLLIDNAERRTLFLFDQDLSEDGGDPEGGIKIIASLLASDTSGHLICGLWTHTVTPEEHLQRWETLSETPGIVKDRFVVIPKRLSEDPVLLAQMLKLVALSPDFAEMKEKTRSIMVEAAKEAASRVDDIRIYDFDYIVFQVPAREGMWEPDMLFRLHSLFHRLEARRLAHEGGELEALASRLRSVSHISTESQSFPAPSTWKIQQEELYESVDHLNRNHLPLELGDIFVKTGVDGRKRYILLAQPCDLMVRPGGKREPELVHVALAEVVQVAEVPQGAEEMDYFGTGPADRWIVKMRQVHQVRTLVLDLCVFQDSGQAAIHIEGDCPIGLRPSWEARFGRVQKEYARLATHLECLAPRKGDADETKKARSRIAKELAPCLLREAPFRGEISHTDGHKTIAFNCQRIGRLSQARAFGLLMNYTSSLSRPAHDRDFGPAERR